MNPVHELTIEINPDVAEEGRWRLVATCSCLHFGRTGTGPTKEACQHAADTTIDQEHLLHMARIAAGTHVVPTGPDWLP